MQRFRSLDRRDAPQPNEPLASWRFAVNRVQLEIAAAHDAIADVKRDVRDGATREDAMQRLTDIREQTLSALGQFGDAFAETAKNAGASAETLDAEMERLANRFRADIERVQREWATKLDATEASEATPSAVEPRRSSE